MASSFPLAVPSNLPGSMQRPGTSNRAYLLKASLYMRAAKYSGTTNNHEYVWDKTSWAQLPRLAVRWDIHTRSLCSRTAAKFVLISPSTRPCHAKHFAASTQIQPCTALPLQESCGMQHLRPQQTGLEQQPQYAWQQPPNTNWRCKGKHAKLHRALQQPHGQPDPGMQFHCVRTHKIQGYTHIRARLDQPHGQPGSGMQYQSNGVDTQGTKP